ncbi:MAG TPA: ROK family protein [Acidimicrobiales bacterium]|nr:ROK family protein [Acidimicrobiales bacterium]
MATVGVDLGGTKCLGVLLDDGGSIVAEARRATPQGAERVAETLLRVIEELVGTTGAGTTTGVGVGVPGLVDRQGRLRFAPNLPGVRELDVAEVLGVRLGLPVVVENDASCAAWAERCLGAGAGVDDMILVTLGTGIGGGLVLGGRLYTGANGFAGEIGHMIVDPAGPACPCGQRGCWEQFASGNGLGRLGREAAAAGTAPRLTVLAGGDPDAVRGEHVSAAFAEGDPGAAEVMATYAFHVGLGLANLANIFDPSAFVLGGGLVEMGDALFDPVRRAFTSLVEAADHRPPVAIVAAALGEDAGAVGAGLLARGIGGSCT